MNEIIKVKSNNGLATVSSREVAENFGKRHDNVLRDIENMKRDVLNFEEMFFETDIPDSYGRVQKTYEITRDGFSLLAMGFTGKEALEWKLKYIEAFNKLEAEWNSPDMQLARGILAAQKMIESKDAQIAELEPKAEFYDQIMDSHGSVTIDDAAKTLNVKGLGPLKLREYLRNKEVLMENNIPYQRYIEEGYFKVDTRSWRPKNNDPIIYQVTMVTPKGIDYLRKRLG